KRWATKPVDNSAVAVMSRSGGPGTVTPRRAPRLRPSSFYALLSFDACLLEQLSPLRNLLIHVCGQGFGVGTLRQQRGTQTCHAILEGLVGQTSLQGGLEFVERFLGRALGRPHAVPDADFKTIEPGFLHGGKVRQRGDALRTGDRVGLHRAGLDV